MYSNYYCSWVGSKYGVLWLNEDLELNINTYQAWFMVHVIPGETLNKCILTAAKETFSDPLPNEAYNFEISPSAAKKIKQGKPVKLIRVYLHTQTLTEKES